jgi:hypothetical protein
MSKKKTIVEVVQDPENKIAVQVLAADIQRISAGIKALRRGDLADDTLLLLIQHAAPANKRSGQMYKPISLYTIKMVLAGLENLAATHVKRK